MIKTFLRYGLYSATFIVALFAFNMWIGGFGTTMVAGYLTMVLALCFVYFGLRYYRDKQNNGVLSFGQGLKLGMLITLAPSIAIGLFDIVYIKYINPGFYDKYLAAELVKLKARVPADQYEAQAAALREQMANLSQPWADFLFMFAQVAAIGLIITVISTFILKRKQSEEAAYQFEAVK